MNLRLRDEQAVRHISQSSALDRNRTAPPSNHPGCRPSWLTTIEVQSGQNEQQLFVQPPGFQENHNSHGGLASIIGNQVHTSLNNTSNSTPISTQPTGLRVPSHDGGARTVSGIFPLMPPAQPPSSSPSHGLMHQPVASRPFTPASRDAGVEELSRQLQLQRVQTPSVISNAHVSSLIQQSTAVGRNAEQVLSAVAMGPARSAAKDAVETGRRGRDGANDSVLRGGSRSSSHGAPAHVCSHDGRTGVVGSDAASPRGYHELYNSAVSAVSARYTGHAHLKPEAQCTPAAPVASSVESTRLKDASAARDRCLAPQPRGHLAPARPPPFCASTPGIHRPTDTRGPFRRAPDATVYPAPDVQDAPLANTRTSLITRQSTTTSQPSLATINAITPGTQASGFVPMLAVTRPDMTGRDVTPMPLGSQAVLDLKFSPHYRGMHTETNASADHLAPDQNCSLWITQLPPDVQVTELLGKIRNIGRVYATVLSPPDGIKHPKCAAKLVFFTPAGAQKLLACGEAHPLIVRGHKAQIMPNRTKCDSQSTERGESRVLIITGYKSFVNEASLTAYFEGRFTFQIDKVQTLVEFQDRAVVEYQFGSYRCQAQMGLKALLLDRPRGLEMVEFGADPCEVGSDTTSFTVASERIQGRGLFADLDGR